MKGENAEKRGHSGKDWWGKRPLAGLSCGYKMKFWKRLLHKKERAQAKKEINQEIA